MSDESGASAEGAAEAASPEDAAKAEAAQGAVKKTATEAAEDEATKAAEAKALDDAAEKGGETTATEDEPVMAERVDEDGLPLDRAATIDDVRLRSGLHGRFALGCVVIVVLLIAAFWMIRAGMGE
jgi:hypothetical protein